MRKIFTKQETIEETNEENIYDLYLTKKAELHLLDKEVKDLNEKIKSKMAKDEVKFVNHNGYKINRVETNKIKWNTDALLTKVKEFNIPDLTEQVEQVNMTKLEECILNGDISTDDLESCRTITTSTSLRVTKIKQQEED